MSRGYNNFVSIDYICTECGNINPSFNIRGDIKAKYSTGFVYCPNCKRNTSSIKLCDGAVVRSELEFSDFNSLSDVQKCVYDLMGISKGKIR
ncbi:MAG: hypothetical protein J6D28_00780 [Bacilli bacterium]|nr:hypothetical protein [Bacilli bacterium]